MSRLTTSAHIFRVYIQYVDEFRQRSAEVVAENGEIDSPFSILGCVINVYNSHAVFILTHSQLEMCTSLSLSMKRTRDVYYVCEIYRRQSLRDAISGEGRKSFPAGSSENLRIK